MKEIFISFITFCAIALAVYFNKIDSKNNIAPTQLSSYSTTTTSKFNSGISIKDVGEMIVIEQKPNDATVIIDKNDLEDIIVFLNNTNESE
tara:strand:+ start:1602 stop:1874 length:273 start_codon:yes stop_codon:yes gene_type:complete